ncbi:hypothetical protein B0H16DRAFT_1457491 [Mycena metata]|uniref:Uncharacterized protein n=1 Tax=Mycena metata TaxID=1033252 RepID=A0AAD7J8J7_9AGAR|nr:hypothetical protein B0H16DRAFT_1457491 [Mycena metata]
MSSVIPTSDPYEELLPNRQLESDPYEEVIIPGYSQRDETREAVDAELQSLYDLGEKRALRRARLEMEAHPGSLTPAGTPTTKIRGDDMDFDLLRLRCNDLEEERDNAQRESAKLTREGEELRQELHQLRVSLAFFTKETGRWRWVAANARTRLETAMRVMRAGIHGASWEFVLDEFEVAITAVINVLRN